ncbi:CD19: B-lymphocyte antigen CD19 [Crotalus adamanteus]|uniref:CD19: B-lymphocyte antigen CD19 n=1 Tax=Crotalus adamanteus TaxID=8729 RepID=A0AAW1B5K0_CROAD
MCSTQILMSFIFYMSLIFRRYFYAKRNKRSNRIMVCPENDDVTEQVDAYENVRPDVGAQRGQKLLQKGKILPNTLKMEGKYR